MKNSARRKLMIATWDAPREGNIHGKITLDVTNALAWIEHLRTTSGEKVTLTHVVGKAIANALAKTPTLNGRIFLGKYIPHDFVSVTYLVVLEGGKDLAKARVDDADKKSTVDTCKDLRARAERLRGGKDDDFEKSKGIINLLPTWLLKPVLKLTGWLTTSLGLDLPSLGLARYPFGSCVITSVGMLGLDEGFAPFTPFAGVPLLVLLGAAKPRPAVLDGQLVVRPLLTITATIDHRFLDGAQGATIAKIIREQLESPWLLEGLPAAPEGFVTQKCASA